MEPENIKAITEKYFHTAYRLALSRTNSISDAEYVAREVFLRLIKNKFSEIHITKADYEDIIEKNSWQKNLLDNI